jgi:hypothetical protein
MDPEFNEIISIIDNPDTKISIEKYEILRDKLILGLDILLQSVDDDIYRVSNGSNYESYISINDVIKRIIDNNEEIYIYVEHVNKYLVFNNEEKFTHFMSEIYSRKITNLTENTLDGAHDVVNYENKDTADFIKYQIIPINIPQKLILAYDSKDVIIIGEICEQAKIHFKAECITLYNYKWKLGQLIIDIMLNCFNDNRIYCKKFYDYLENYKKGYGSYLVRPLIKNNIKYDVDYIDAIVKYNFILTSSASIVNSNIGNNGKYGAGDAADDKYNIVRCTTEFIIKNPPHNKESVNDYTERYKSFCKLHNIIPATKLNKYMILQNYMLKHSGSLYYWESKNSIKVSNQPFQRLLAKYQQKQLLLLQNIPHEYIYFITEIPYANKVKIGKTKDPESRLKTLQTGNPNKLCLYHKIYAPISDNLESVLHKEHAAKRIQGGEWFRFTIEELNNEVMKYL